MPFIDSAESLSAKTHTSDVKSPLLIGVLVLAGIAVVIFVYNIITYI